ncbi:hypothetical protein, partial [Enterobacter intestinihominis]
PPPPFFLNNNRKKFIILGLWWCVIFLYEKDGLSLVLGQGLSLSQNGFGYLKKATGVNYFIFRSNLWGGGGAGVLGG